MADESNADLLLQKAECLAAYGRHLAHSMGGRTSQWQNVVCCDAGLASAYRNLVVPLRPVSVVAAKELAVHLARFYDSRRKWALWSVFSLDLAGTDFEHSCSDTLSMRRPQPSPVMNTPDVAGLVIREVTDDADVKLFEQVRETANGRVPVIAAGSRLDDRILGNGYHLWLGLLNGLAVATAAIFESDAVSMVKSISTLPGFRHRGIGSAMTVHAVSMSNKPAILDSSLDAAGLYARVGFEEVGRVQFWGRKSPEWQARTKLMANE